jgi:hypothetical protein
MEKTELDRKVQLVARLASIKKEADAMVSEAYKLYTLRITDLGSVEAACVHFTESDASVLEAEADKALSIFHAALQRIDAEFDAAVKAAKAE